MGIAGEAGKLALVGAAILGGYLILKNKFNFDLGGIFGNGSGTTSQSDPFYTHPGGSIFNPNPLGHSTGKVTQAQIDAFGQNGIAGYDEVRQDQYGNVTYWLKGKPYTDQNSQTVNQSNRDYADVAAYLGRSPTYAPGIPTYAGGGKVTGVTLNKSTGQVTAVTRHVTTAAAVHTTSQMAAAARSKASAAAKKAGKKCYNTGLVMGGVNHIDYRVSSEYHGL